MAFVGTLVTGKICHRKPPEVYSSILPYPIVFFGKKNLQKCRRVSGKWEMNAIRLLLTGNILGTYPDFGFVNLPTRVDSKWEGGGGAKIFIIYFIII